MNLQWCFALSKSALMWGYYCVKYPTIGFCAFGPNSPGGIIIMAN